MTKLSVISPDIDFLISIYRQCSHTQLKMTGYHPNSSLISHLELKRLKLIRYDFWSSNTLKQQISAEDIVLIDTKLSYQNDREWRTWLKTYYPTIVTEAVQIASYTNSKIIFARPIIQKLGRVDWSNQYQSFIKSLIFKGLINQDNMDILSYKPDNIHQLLKGYIN